MGDISSLVVISGPSKAGKTTLVELLCKEESRLQRVVTATTRDPRLKEDGVTHEKDGKDYYFVNANYFNRNGIILEKACVHGNWYGTPKKSVDQLLRDGKVPLWILDVQGAEAISTRFGQAYHYEQQKVKHLAKITYIFLLPTYSEVVQRLERNHDKNKDKRLKSAEMEIGYLQGDVYNYLLYTSNPIEQNLRELRAIIFDEKSEVAKACRLTDRKKEESLLENWLKT
ncbi:MAG: hypothetical protein WC471_00100 [Candidatus Woesearchaeota archaeon]